MQWLEIEFLKTCHLRRAETGPEQCRGITPNAAITLKIFHLLHYHGVEIGS